MQSPRAPKPAWLTLMHPALEAPSLPDAGPYSATGALQLCTLLCPVLLGQTCPMQDTLSPACRPKLCRVSAGLGLLCPVLQRKVSLTCASALHLSFCH